MKSLQISRDALAKCIEEFSPEHDGSGVDCTACWTLRAARKAIALIDADLARVTEAVGQVVSSGPANLPIFQWLSADHSFRVPIGSKLYATPQEAAAPEWIPVGERLPKTGEVVVVRAPAGEGDWTNDDRICLDFISEDYEDWHEHCGSYENYMAVGGSGAAGPDCVCTGPSEKAPYTHWAPIPPIEKVATT